MITRLLLSNMDRRGQIFLAIIAAAGVLVPLLNLAVPAGSPFHGPGLVRMLRIDDGRLKVVGEAPVGTWAQGVAFAPDGRTLFVGNMLDKDISVFRVAEDGQLSEAGPRIRLNGASAALRVADRPAR